MIKEVIKLLQQFKTFDAERLDLDELVALSAFADAMLAQYAAFGIDVPEWASANKATIEREVRGRTQDALAKSLREKELELERLTPAEEKRKRLTDQIAALKEKLGK